MLSCIKCLTSWQDFCTTTSLSELQLSDEHSQTKQKQSFSCFHWTHRLETPTTFTRCFLLFMRQLWENLNNSPQQTSFNSSVILWCCHCFVLFCCKSQTFLVKVSCCLDFFSKISGISLNCYLNSSNTASLQKGSYKPRWSLLHASQSRFF